MKCYNSKPGANIEIASVNANVYIVRLFKLITANWVAELIEITICKNAFVDK